MELEPDLPLVLINPILIGQVLTNLLENALKYAPAGSPIAIVARRGGDSAGSEGVVVSVRDAGLGVPSGEQARIFDKFYRGHAGSRQLGGVGLGLTVCKGIVEAHGGWIWVEPAPGGGAAFVFTLPQTASAGELAPRDLSPGLNGALP